MRKLPVNTDLTISVGMSQALILPFASIREHSEQVAPLPQAAYDNDFT